jgi:twitching motility two-component system response regulator PilH
MAKILVVDDSITEREVMKNGLEDEGYSVTIAKDGEEALEILKKEKFDCILLDVIMPKINGFQVCREIKKDEFTKDIPVILVTSKGQESDMFWGKKQGADDYIVKPFKIDDLVKIVKRFVK